MTRPEIVDDDTGAIKIMLDGVVRRCWSYRGEADRASKMRQAHQWCDGYTVAAMMAEKRESEQ